MVRMQVIRMALGLAVVAGVAGIVQAEVKVDRMFSGHMVLQRDLAVPVWGTAAAGEKITVRFRDQAKKVEAGRDGKWMVRLDPMKPGDPGTLTVQGSNTVSMADVLVGDVWIGSGQSNMAGGAGKYAGGDEVLAAMIKKGPYPQLRLYRGSWKVAAPKEISGFSALMFSFGQPLQKELGVPVGLFVGAVGGTPSGRWLSLEMFEANEGCRKAMDSEGGAKTKALLAKYKKDLADWQAAVKKAKEERKPAHPLSIGDLYAAHIQWAAPYGIRGVLWDQGEAGTAVPGVDQFTMMGALVRGWRKAWGQGEFPFLCVQKPSGGGCAWDEKGNPLTRMASKFMPQPTKPNHPGNGGWRCSYVPMIRLPKSALVTTSDLGGGIHPPDKSSYGRRACDIALSFVYGGNTPIYGPLYDSHKVERKSIRVRFKHVGKGLVCRNGDKLQGFEIAGKDHPWHWADAKIEGDTVVVSSEKVAEPVHVRYKSHNSCSWANLFNKDRWPAFAFNTRWLSK